MKIDIAFVVVTYNSEDDIERCIESISSHFVSSSFEWCVVVVDNNSQDKTTLILSELEKKFHWLKTIYQDENLGFGVANNKGFASVDADYYVLVNADAWLVTDNISGSINTLRKNSDVAICGVPLVFPDGSPQTFAFSFSSWVKWVLHLIGMRAVVRKLLVIKCVGSLMSSVGFAKEFVASQEQKVIDMQNINESFSFSLRDVDWVCGAGMIIKGDFISKTGGFDPNIFLYGEDEDLCIEAHTQGQRVVAIDSPPLSHMFGWGKNKMNQKVANLKYDSLKYFVAKNIRSYPEKKLMTWLLPFHVYGWIRFYYAWIKKD